MESSMDKAQAIKASSKIALVEAARGLDVGFVSSITSNEYCSSKGFTISERLGAGRFGYLSTCELPHAGKRAQPARPLVSEADSWLRLIIAAR
jgi:hypothetical protein